MDETGIAFPGKMRSEHFAHIPEARCAGRTTRRIRPARRLALGLSSETLQDDLRSFPGLAHRMEQVGRRGHVLFVNDSKGTNADAAAHALSSFGDIFWIAGGKPKLGGITALADYFPRIRKAYLIGEAAPLLADTLHGKVQYETSGTLANAVASAFADASGSACDQPVVLLSPACASFDQFRDFEARGDAFRALVHDVAAHPVREAS